MAKNGTLSPLDAETIAQDFVHSLDDADRMGGEALVRRILDELAVFAHKRRFVLPTVAQTPFDNSGLSLTAYPGDLATEARISAALRWNAMAMVVRANRESDGIGGHIASYASSLTLYEVGFHHFFRGPQHPCGGDHLFIQGHVAPGIYARAFLEGRLSEERLDGFRREGSKGGLSSYPHPWLMPDFWQHPTVSMGLGPMNAIRQARFFRYLEDRGLMERRGARIYAFLGDGECDEPEALSALSLASRERLENLVFVINCNLQRLDGPVRGNGKIVQELEAVFRARGWNVIKAIHSQRVAKALAADTTHALQLRLAGLPDGELQRCRLEGPVRARQRLANGSPELAKVLDGWSDDLIGDLLAGGGHDPVTMHGAYRSAVDHLGSPSVILALTTKGFGMGTAGEALNTAHQQKKLKKEELRIFRDRFGLSIADEALESVPYARLSAADQAYLLEHRYALGGFLPSRNGQPRSPVSVPAASLYGEFDQGTAGREVSTTSVLVRILSKLVREKDIGPRVVPIIPDESRTFGLDALFRQIGIYSAVGQLYEPVDSESLMRYRESTDGQILQEGIDEAGAIASFHAAATSYASTGVSMVPFYLFYSMFGLQRVGDQVWAVADARGRGFLIGGTAGRTTLNGEGLQHQDGQSHLLAQAVPTLRSYDPAFAFELAAIVKFGLERMMRDQQDVFYYVTVANESYAQPPRPTHVTDAMIERGAYLWKRSANPLVGLLGSGPILREVLAASDLLEKYEVPTEVYAVTSWNELRREAVDAERSELSTGSPVSSHVKETFGASTVSLFVAASDYVKALPDGIAKWLPARLVALGTDGFGQSDTREALRAKFEVDARSIALYALLGLAREGKISAERVARIQAELV